MTLSFKKDGGEVYHVRITKTEQGECRPAENARDAGAEKNLAQKLERRAIDRCSGWQSVCVWFGTTVHLTDRVDTLATTGYLNDGDPRTFPTLAALAKSKPRTLKTPIYVGQV